MFVFALMGMLAGSYADTLVTNGVRMKFKMVLSHKTVQPHSDEVPGDV